MRRELILFLALAFFLGCKESGKQSSQVESKGKIAESAASRIKEKTRKAVEELIEAPRAVNVEVKVKAPEADNKEIRGAKDVSQGYAGEKGEIISDGRWFFAARNRETGQINYYDKNGNFLGRD